MRLGDPLQGLLQVLQPLDQEVAVLQHQPLSTSHCGLQQLQSHLQEEGSVGCGIGGGGGGKRVGRGWTSVPKPGQLHTSRQPEISEIRWLELR